MQGKLERGYAETVQFAHALLLEALLNFSAGHQSGPLIPGFRIEGLMLNYRLDDGYL